MRVPIVVTVKLVSSRLPFKSLALIKYTLDYIESIGQLDNTAVIGDSDLFQSICDKRKVKYFDEATEFPGCTGHIDLLHNIGVKWGLEMFILMQVTNPYREKWLYNAFVNRLIRCKRSCYSVVDKRGVGTRGLDDLVLDKRTQRAASGAMYGIYTSDLEGRDKFPYDEASPVTHNADAYIDVDYIDEMPTAEELVSKLNHVYHLPIVATEAEIYLGTTLIVAAGDKDVKLPDLSAYHSVIFVNWIANNRYINHEGHIQSIKEVTRTVHHAIHFTPHGCCLHNTPDGFTHVANRGAHVISTPPGKAYKYTTPAGLSSMTREINKLFVTDSQFSSTGLDAVLWAWGLTQDADEIHLVGFKHEGDKPDILGHPDKRAEWMVENKLLQELAKTNKVKFL